MWITEEKKGKNNNRKSQHKTAEKRNTWHQRGVCIGITNSSELQLVLLLGFTSTSAKYNSDNQRLKSSYFTSGSLFTILGMELAVWRKSNCIAWQKWPKQGKGRLFQNTWRAEKTDTRMWFCFEYNKDPFCNDNSCKQPLGTYPSEKKSKHKNHNPSFHCPSSQKLRSSLWSSTFADSELIYIGRKQSHKSKDN